VLYCDTDSVIYVQNVGESQKVMICDHLGDLTDELEGFGAGSCIENFVSGRTKTMRFLSFAPPQERGQQNTK